MNAICRRLLAAGLVVSVLGVVIDAQEESSPEDEDLNAQMVLAFRSRSFAQAKKLAEAAWLRYEQKGRKQGDMAAANLGAIYAFNGKIDEAEAWQDRAEGFLKSTEDQALQGQLARARAITAYIGATQFGNAEPDDALAHIERARNLLGDEAIRMCECQVLSNSNQGNRVQSGYVKFRKLIETLKTEGDSLALARCLLSMGWIEGASGGHGAAEGSFKRAHRIYESERHTDAALLAQRNFGVALWQNGKEDAAIEQFQKALKKAQDRSDLRMQVILFNDLAMVFARMEKEDEAIAYDRQAQDALAELSQALASGHLEDSVVFDFSLLIKMRLNLPRKSGHDEKVIL
jgi:tetratricopeptide (TPR) repeat protein